MRYLIFPICLYLFIISCNDDKKDEPGNNGSPSQELVSGLTERANKYPDSLHYRADLIDALDSLGRYPEALSQMAILLQKDSLNNSLWARNALLLERSGDTTAAIKSYYRSLDIYPDPANQLYLANLLAERRDDRALLLVNNVSKTKFDDETLAHCDFIAGVYHARKGNLKLAEQLFNRCISRDVRYMVAYLEKGFLYYEAKRFEDALKVFNLAATLDAKYADAFYWQGKTYEALGKTEEAINMYEEAHSLDPAMKEATAAINRLRAVKG